MRTRSPRRELGIAILVLFLLALVLPAQAAPARLDPRLVEYLASSPDGQGSFLVFLKDQADLSGAPAIAGRTARVTYVYERLRATAERSQAALRADLASWGVPYRPFFIVNAIRVTGDLALARKLAARPEVARLVADPPFNGLDDPPAGPAGPPAVDGIEWNVNRLHAPEVWALGHTGQGIVVGSVDTGVDWDHPALINQYRPQIPGAPSRHDYNWAEPDGTSTEPYDPNGHGTHTTGTMVGDDGGSNQVGVAPGAQWIACKVDSNGVWQASKYIACWEWMMAPTRLDGSDPQPALAAHVVNNSWSCPESEGCTPDTLLPAAQALYAAGIAIAKSAGNAGPNCGTITNPGQYYELLATAAFNSSDNIASFSSRGPSEYQSETRLKPDIAAPGVAIRSSYTGGGYSTLQGTSMASPHTAGVIALVWSAEPSLVGDLAATYRLLKYTAEPKISDQCPPYVDHPNNVWGWGIITALAAAQPGELRGTVYDEESLAPLPGSTVEVEPIGGGLVRQTTADANAVYSFTLPAGHYVITATHPGYFPTAGAAAVFSGTTATHDIALQPLPPCEPVEQAEFTWAPLTPTLGQQITFTGTATGTLPITYTWSWGDGTFALVPCPLPPATCSITHTYPQPGAYTVVMTATNCTAATASAAHIVTVLGVPRIVLPPLLPPVALDAGQQASISFSVANSGTADLEWSLAEVPEAAWLEVTPAGGTLAPGEASDVLLTYTAPLTPGLYTTTLRAASNDPLSPSVDLLAEMEVEEVEHCIPITNVSFSWLPLLPGVGHPISFSAMAPALPTPPITYTWSFGDGGSGNGEAVTHAFASPGTYTVSLTATNACGQATATSPITVVRRIYLPLVTKGNTR